jgi:spore coat polysaccharide biosynthesis protein SpsF
MGSSRLPGKVLMDVAGRPLLARVLERVGMAETVDEVVLATSDSSADGPLAELAEDLGVRCHRGSEQDVLRRMHEAANVAAADVVVRVTGDCPLIDPGLVDEVVGTLVAGQEPCDYASNVIRRTYPKGLDAEALHADVLTRIDRLAVSPESRQHVTWFAVAERSDLFVLRSVELREDWSHLDWSVDDSEDLERVRALYARHGLATVVRSWRELLDDPDGAD